MSREKGERVGVSTLWIFCAAFQSPPIPGVTNSFKGTAGLVKGVFYICPQGRRKCVLEREKQEGDSGRNGESGAASPPHLITVSYCSFTVFIRGKVGYF